VIDAEGYRPNVGMIMCNDQCQVFWARRIGQDSWQFPQGGIKQEENPEQALYRELQEEVGLPAEAVDIIGMTRGWLRYRLPRKMIRHDSYPVCVGQKQKWFMLRLKADEELIKTDYTSQPEFDGWRWVSYWYPIGQVVSFKREVYRRAMREFAHILFKNK